MAECAGFLSVKLQYPAWMSQRWAQTQAEIEQDWLQQAQVNARGRLESAGAILEDDWPETDVEEAH